MRTTIITIIVLVVIALLGWYFLRPHGALAPAPTPVASVSYTCSGGKTIQAAYYDGTSTPAVVAGQPPVPTGYVDIALDNGTSMTLPQTISADGARYASADGSFVFWNKGNGVMVQDTSGASDYTGCIAVAPDPGGLPQVYTGGSGAFSLRYPAGYTPDPTYQYQEMGPGKEINGVKFTISPSIASGTNLSADSYISVEQIPSASDCSASLFLDDPGAVAQTVTDGDTTYSFASSTGAGAGNRYEETVYALPGTSPCTAVRYFIHYGVIENYPPGAVEQFDEASLKAQFDAIRRTLTLQ